MWNCSRPAHTRIRRNTLSFGSSSSGSTGRTSHGQLFIKKTQDVQLFVYSFPQKRSKVLATCENEGFIVTATHSEEDKDKVAVFCH